MVQEIQQENASLIDLNMRIRVLEEKQNLIRENLLVINQNMVEEYKRLMRELKTLKAEMGETKEEINNSKEIIKNMIKEMGKFAKNDSVKVLEKYIKLWDPLKFVTEDEVINMLKREVRYNGDRQVE